MILTENISFIGALYGLLAVCFGAFGAHALKKKLTPEKLQSFETGVKYQMYHALFLLVIGLLNTLSEKAKKAIYYLTIIGLLFFSGSIYGLATNDITNFDFKTIGFITPIGGLLLISALAILLINFLKMKSDKS